MTFEDFVKNLADIEGKAALEKYSYDWWQQAAPEEREKLILAIDQLTGPVRKMVKSFWECCGVAISEGWVTVDGKNYAITPKLLSKPALPDKVPARTIKNTVEFKTYTSRGERK